MSKPLTWLCCTAGTPQHVPPEYSFRGRYRAGPTTVWQLGVVLYEMLHDEDFSTIPFLLNNLLINEDLSDGRAQKPPPFLNFNLNPNSSEWPLSLCPSFFSPECLDFLDKCLEIFPKRRMKLEDMQFHPWFSESTTIFSNFSMLSQLSFC